MKYLSLILSMYVLLLSVMPCCFEDKCLSVYIPTVESGVDTHNNCDDCSDNGYNCCSPFLHCDTCSGFPEAHHYSPISVVIGLVSDCKSDYIERNDLPDFKSLIWQPPQA